MLNIYYFFLPHCITHLYNSCRFITITESVWIFPFNVVFSRSPLLLHPLNINLFEFLDLSPPPSSSPTNPHWFSARIQYVIEICWWLFALRIFRLSHTFSRRNEITLNNHSANHFHGNDRLCNYPFYHNKLCNLKTNRITLGSGPEWFNRMANTTPTYDHDPLATHNDQSRSTVKLQLNVVQKCGALLTLSEETYCVSVPVENYYFGLFIFSDFRTARSLDRS